MKCLDINNLTNVQETNDSYDGAEFTASCNGVDLVYKVELDVNHWKIRMAVYQADGRCIDNFTCADNDAREFRLQLMEKSNDARSNRRVADDVERARIRKLIC